MKECSFSKLDFLGGNSKLDFKKAYDEVGCGVLVRFLKSKDLGIDRGSEFRVVFQVLVSVLL